jgi:hypothetical protein
MAVKATVTMVVSFSVSMAVGCASAVQPRSFSRPVTVQGADVFGCALGHLNAQGYTVLDANKEAGFIRAEKKTSGLGRALMVGQNLFDQMTISIFQDPATRQTTLRVTAATMSERAMGWGAGSRNVTDPSPALEADAHRVLDACSQQ